MVEGRTERGGEGMEKGIKMGYVHVPTAHKEYKHYILQSCTNKSFKNLSKSFSLRSITGPPPWYRGDERTGKNRLSDESSLMSLSQSSGLGSYQPTLTLKEKVLLIPQQKMPLSSQKFFILCLQNTLSDVSLRAWDSKGI